MPELAPIERCILCGSKIMNKGYDTAEGKMCEDGAGCRRRALRLVNELKNKIAIQPHITYPHDCREHDLERVEHEANGADWEGQNTTQGYQVYRCKTCNDYWGCRYQYDAGTGSDDRWHRFGPNIEDVKRHY